MRRYRQLVAGGFRRLAASAFAAAVAIAAAGCGKKVDPVAPAAPAAGASAPNAVSLAANVVEPRWVFKSNPRAPHAVVFVHGLFGDTLGTWTNDNGSSFFEHLRASKSGDQFDVFAFGFTSKMLGNGSLDVRESANKLQQWLQFEGVTDYPSIAFVAHSMGGLVVLRHLISAPELAKKVPLVVLYATPQEGAQISVIADKVARNPALAQMFPADKNAFLQQLSDDWRRLPERPRVSCGYEKKPMGGVMIVPWSSATRFCDDTPVAIEDTDHSTLVKPAGPRHDSVVLLVNALHNHVLQRKVADRRADIKIGFKPYPAMENLGKPPALELTLDDPVPSGPFGFRLDGDPNPVDYRHRQFALPRPGQMLIGYVNRFLYSAYQINAANAPAIKTRVCVKGTDAPVASSGAVELDCVEGDACVPRDANGPLAACGASKGAKAGGWWDWFPAPSAHAAQADAAKSSGPAVGDWLIPRLETLRDARSTAAATAYSEFSLTLESPPAVDGVDAVSFEAKVNGHRLWVNGMPAWAHAIPYKGDGPLTLSFGLENLNASGAQKGREELEVRMVLLKNRQPVAHDTIRLHYVALRDQPQAVVVTSGGRQVRWSAQYFPAQRDQYQILAYGGKEPDAIAAKVKFDRANARRSGADGLPLVGVVRPALPTNPSWGVSVGEVLPSGQVRFSFQGLDAVAVCRSMVTDAARARFRRNGFPDPAAFAVRVIATDTHDAKPKALVPCSTFSIS